RMFSELRILQEGRVPFIRATSGAGDLCRILASIEGPPETPYKGGIFWVLVYTSKLSPPGAPTIRFHVKIYQSNIDH
ncbi:hypothetical protein B0J14DRAFT_496155, partial [Halenospora varia]